jgi:exodeoxyribonuclease V alpha subunit
MGPLDDYFAELIVRLNGTRNSDLAVAARAVSAWRGAGHSCLPLTALSGEPAEFAASLRSCDVVGQPGDWKPLILDFDNRLYLHRYWNYEAEIAAAVRERVNRPPRDLGPALCEAIDEVVGDQISEQRTAVELALTRDLCVITGGPGTGKTRTVAYLTAVLQRLQPDGERLRLALAAPTGKAAARIGESLRASLAELRAEGRTISDRAPEPATLHRLLGASGDLSSARHSRENPIPADVVIVDEASMIDLALMWRLITALLPHARLILLGDKDQLASVEAGNVFGDLCAGAGEFPESELAKHIVTLHRSFRVSAESGLHRTSHFVRAGDSDATLRVLMEEAHEDLNVLTPGCASTLPQLIKSTVQQGYQGVLAAQSPDEALASFNQFRVLCALRTGPFGVEQINQTIQHILFERSPARHFGFAYHKQPIMVLENDYGLRLFNGDVGMVWQTGPDNALRAFFPTPDGGLRQIAVARLPRSETAWAMTVHKSQGSEFDRVLCVLPENDSRVLTRELVYTALTRARSQLTICGSREILRTSLHRPTTRSSGLRDALWNASAT